MKSWHLLVAALFGLAIAAHARDEYATTVGATRAKAPRTYYSYSYTPATGASVKVRNYRSGTTTTGSGGSVLYQRAATATQDIAQRVISSGALQSAATKYLLK